MCQNRGVPKWWCSFWFPDLQRVASKRTHTHTHLFSAGKVDHIDRAPLYTLRILFDEVRQETKHMGYSRLPGSSKLKGDSWPARHVRLSLWMFALRNFNSLAQLGPLTAQSEGVHGPCLESGGVAVEI